MNQSMQTLYKATNSCPTSEDERALDLVKDPTTPQQDKKGNNIYHGGAKT